MAARVRPGPRPFVYAGIIFSGLAVIFLLLIGIGAARWSAAVECALAFLSTRAGICAAIYGNRILVTDDYLDYRLCFVSNGRVYFKDITTSVPVTPAERDWPLILKIYGRDRSRPEMTLLMKPWRKADVDWLLSLPELKLQSR